MKNLIVCLVTTSLTFSVAAQVKKPVAAAKSAKSPAGSKFPARPTQGTAVLKTSTDSLSYAIGMSVANFYKQQGIDKVNSAMVTRAINDAMKGQKTVLDEQQCNNLLISYVQKVKSEKSSVARKEGEAFLAGNKSKEGVTTTASGLQYQVITTGTGPKPTASDKVKCNYEGRLIDGTVFDSSIKQGQPIEFAVGGVIPGWTEALQLMPVGSKWRLFIPADLAYGDRQAGPEIKPGSTLIFEVELLDIVK